jgi:hypothetical protein
VIAVADGGKTTLENLHALCRMCHCELSWLWLNAPPVPYARWLKQTPAVIVMRTLHVLAGESDRPSFIPAGALERELGIDRATARRLLMGARR